MPKVPADISQNIKTLLTETALKAFNALQCKSYARVDIRLSKNNIPYVIDINPNPDIMPDSGFANSAKAAGIEYPELLHTILTLAKQE
jgi:D-alanine-D-alanine ligase